MIGVGWNRAVADGDERSDRCGNVDQAFERIGPQGDRAS